MDEETNEGEEAPVYSQPVEETEEEISPLDRHPGGEHTWAESLDGIEVGDT
ncbi:MAG: hypothetical protein GWN18_04220, partial [Thermoplasmata archaeon]|nr:hypothetical protein [Thermoplasmata archaeon]NIT78072.1 hypothetical protein [Thermoplasmata archaeon]NIW81788.1 hypothetical protein [Thermoplasmata archaeon]NIY04442.1 hypothetical protein [Thermoplasmata archaeon]